jgi:N-methylhydantoinase B
MAITTKGQTLLQPDQVASLITAGSGGYGDPHDRDRALVARDLADDKISADQAREDYGYEP